MHNFTTTYDHLRGFVRRDATRFSKVYKILNIVVGVTVDQVGNHIHIEFVHKPKIQGSSPPSSSL